MLLKAMMVKHFRRLEVVHNSRFLFLPLTVWSPPVPISSVYVTIIFIDFSERLRIFFLTDLVLLSKIIWLSGSRWMFNYLLQSNLAVSRLSWSRFRFGFCVIFIVKDIYLIRIIEADYWGRDEAINHFVGRRD